MPVNMENSAVITGLENVSFHYNPKEGQCHILTTIQLCSFHMLVRLCSKSFKLGFSSSWPENFQMCKLGFKEVEEPEIKPSKSFGSWRKQESSRKKSNPASLTTMKALTVWIARNCGKFLKGWEYQITLPVSWETLMWVKKQQNWTWNNWLVQNWERSTSRLYIVTLLI